MRSRPLSDGVDVRAIARALERWLSEKTDWKQPRVLSVSAPEGTGTGDFIWLVSVVEESDRSATASQYALRIHRSSSTIRNFDRSFKMIHALSSIEDVPVPDAIKFESNSDYFGAQFYLMSHIAGRVAPDHPPYTFESWVRDASPREQEQLWTNVIDVVCALHSIDPGHDAFSFLGAGHVSSGRDHTLATWKTAIEKVDDIERRNHILSRLDRLSSAAPPLGGPDCVVWGDCRLPNVIFRGSEVAALIDFEDARLDQPEVDLAMWLLQDDLYTRGLGLSRLPGFPSHEETIERFEEAIGRKVVDLGWWSEYCRFQLSLTGRLR